MVAVGAERKCPTYSVVRRRRVSLGGFSRQELAWSADGLDRRSPWVGRWTRATGQAEFEQANRQLLERLRTAQIQRHDRLVTDGFSHGASEMVRAVPEPVPLEL